MLSKTNLDLDSIFLEGLNLVITISQIIIKEQDFGLKIRNMVFVKTRDLGFKFANQKKLDL
jgi:hypothetical protein